MAAVNGRHFERVPLFDRNIGAGLRGQINRAVRRGNIKRNPMRPSQHGDRVCADLVGHIAIGRDPIRADDADLNLPLTHEATGHIVCNHRDRDLILHEFPGGQPRTLQHGSGFVGNDTNLLTLFPRCPDDTKRGPISGRR